MISNVINGQIAEALRAKDEVRLSTLRLLSSALHNAKIDKRGELSGAEELVVVKKEAKKRQDAIEAIRLARGKPTSSDPKSLEEKLDKEKKELAVLKEFLPEEMSDEKLAKLVEENIKKAGAKEMKDMGKVIGMVMKEASGRADGAKVAELAKKKLT